MKLIKAIDIVNYYSKLILSDDSMKWVKMQDMDEIERDELEEAVEKVRDFIIEMR
ncbi:hypothetical protein [Lacrimispora indolis]|uniref:hypothetical protein n=1 Tax=Lacrimispora indolis TaxID=69825 RepID=UPI00040FC1FA|nr:hypothetical protein [[Clostridium] methoxybenzovorans]